MDAPEPGQGQPPEEEDLLAQMQAARGSGEGTATTDAAPAAAPDDTPKSKPPKPERAASEPNERRRRTILTAGLVVIALAVASSVLFVVPGFLTHGASASATPQRSPTASGSGSGAPTASGGSSAVPVVPTGPASPSALPTPSPTPSMPAQTAPTARVTFNEVVLYPSITAAKQAATFSFVSDGPGLVSASIVASAPKDASKICLSGDGGTPVCATGATPTASFYSQSIQSKWTVTVGSANEESPTVDVEIAWPSNKASVTVAHVPFQGHPNRDSLRSLTATVTARTAGSLSLGASWGTASLSSSLTIWLVDKTGQHVTLQKTYPEGEALPGPIDFGVKAGATYRLTLANESATSTTNPDLTATLQLP